jgi:hypothetical protein
MTGLAGLGVTRPAGEASAVSIRLDRNRYRAERLRLFQTAKLGSA